jgi:hypothetical protein
MKKGFLFVIITAFVLAACSAAPSSTAPNPASQATADQPAATANVQPAPSLSADEVYQAVSAAWAKLDQAGPRHISQTTSEGLNTEADVVPPDFHQVMSAGGNVIAEQYIINGTIYNNVQGAWTQTPGAGDALSTLGNFSMAVSDSLVYSDGMVNGVEIINGSPAIVYSYSTTLKGVDASAQYKLWVDQISGLPVRSVDVSPDGATIDKTFTYGNSIKITLPADAQNAPASTD